MEWLYLLDFLLKRNRLATFVITFYVKARGGVLVLLLFFTRASFINVSLLFYAIMFCGELPSPAYVLRLFFYGHQLCALNVLASFSFKVHDGCEWLSF